MGKKSSKMSAPVVVNASAKTATVIFLHGLGDTGHGWASALGSLGLSHVKFVCPTAPVSPVTLNGGMAMPSWFDLKGLDIDCEEDRDGIKKARDSIHALIEQEVSGGVPYNRIMLGGFSQGGALALYSTLTNKNTLAGTVGLSCWLPLRSDFPACILGNQNSPMLQCHGDCDPLVRLKFGELTHEFLKKHTTATSFKVYKGLFHSSSEEEMADVKDFVAKYLPVL